ncbi:MAG TPA: anti-sigma factor [Cellulomonas sp.]
MNARPGDRRADDATTRELIGAWALDALDPAERDAVKDLIARDPDAAREARGLHETAAVLGAALARPASDAVRAATLAQVAQTAQERPSATNPTGRSSSDAAPGTPGSRTAPTDAPSSTSSTGTTTRPTGARGTTGPGSTGSTGPSSSRPGSATRGRRSRARLIVIAAVVALAVAVPSTVAWQQGRRAAEAEARNDLLTSMLATPGAQVLAADVTTGGSAVAVVTADAALVTAEGVSDPGDGKVYQLWVMRDGRPVPDATSSVTAGGLQISTDGYRTGDALALTVEPEGGSDQPTTEPVVVLAPA